MSPLARLATPMGRGWVLAKNIDPETHEQYVTLHRFGPEGLDRR